jgi:hypothetical protein
MIFEAPIGIGRAVAIHTFFELGNTFAKRAHDRRQSIAEKQQDYETQDNHSAGRWKKGQHCLNHYHKRVKGSRREPLYVNSTEGGRQVKLR